MPLIWFCSLLMGFSWVIGGCSFMTYTYDVYLFRQLSLFLLKKKGPSAASWGLSTYKTCYIPSYWVCLRKVHLHLFVFCASMSKIYNGHLFLFFRCSLLEFSDSLPLLVLQRDLDLERRKTTSHDEFIYYHLVRSNEVLTKEWRRLQRNYYENEN